MIDDDPAVHSGRDHKRDTRGNIRFNQSGDDVGRRPLRREYQVYADRAAHRRKSGDRRFEFFARRRHQIGKLVDDQNDVRNLFRRYVFIFDFFVIARHVAASHTVQKRITPLHLTQRPLQRLKRFFRFGDDRNEQVRDIVIEFEFDDFRID